MQPSLNKNNILDKKYTTRGYKISLFIATNAWIQILSDVVYLHLISAFFSHGIIHVYNLHQMHLLWISSLFTCLGSILSSLLNLPYLVYAHGLKKGFKNYFLESCFCSAIGIISFWCSFFLALLCVKLLELKGVTNPLYGEISSIIIYGIASIISAVMTYNHIQNEIYEKHHKDARPSTSN